MKAKDNFLVVKVDNKRFANEVPTLNTDWWNYGGINRDVKLIELTANYISDYVVQLKPKSAKEVQGFVNLKGPSLQKTVTVEIPELNVKKTFPVVANRAEINFTLPTFTPWSTENPKLYTVTLKTATEILSERIGFRNIETQGPKLLLNGKQLFLRGSASMPKYHKKVDVPIVTQMPDSYWVGPKNWAVTWYVWPITHTTNA